MDDLFTQMEMYTLANGLKTRRMEKEPTFPIAAPNTLGSGLRINKMEKVKKLGQIRLYTWETIKTEKNMARASSCGLMTAPTKANSFKTTFMVMENMNGKMEENMMEIG